MENVLDIKKNKKLNIVLPKERALGRIEFEKVRCAVLIHLYYEDTIGNYATYINSVPKEIDVYFTYSDNNIKNKIVECFAGHKKNCYFIYKQNRGRDISALLVAAREILLKYDYICFVHDKKEKSTLRKEDTGKWIYSLWENMLGSKTYIENIVYTLKTRDDVGILVPPHILSNKSNQLYMNQWFDDYEITVALSQELRLTCNLNKSKSPITLGSVFWAKRDALMKLLKKEWKYEDFDEEPLPDDGTISHAIERIFAYVAQDAGYATGWVMTDEFASEYIDILQSALEKSFYALDENLGIKYMGEIDHYKDERERLMEFARQYKKTYIYGAGGYGITCLKLLKSIGYVPEGFIETKRDNLLGKIGGIIVRGIDNIELPEDVGIIIAVSYKYQNDIVKRLKEACVSQKNYTIFQRWNDLEENL